MRAHLLLIIVGLAGCEPEVVVEEDPNAALHERYGEDWVPCTVEEYCEATAYKAPADCQPEKVCLKDWRNDDWIPDGCRELVKEAWKCTLEVEWEMCGERECFMKYRAFTDCVDDLEESTSSSSGSSGGSSP